MSFDKSLRKKNWATSPENLVTRLWKQQKEKVKRWPSQTSVTRATLVYFLVLRRWRCASRWWALAAASWTSRHLEACFALTLWFCRTQFFSSGSFCFSLCLVWVLSRCCWCSKFELLSDVRIMLEYILWQKWDNVEGPTISDFVRTKNFPKGIITKVEEKLKRFDLCFVLISS